MAAPTMSYYGFNFTDAKIQYNVSGTLTEVDVLYANKASIKSDDEDITFEGDGQKRHVYITSSLTVELSPDAINVAAAGVVFGKTDVTTGIPNSGTHLNWFGDTTESAGKSAGMRLVGSAIKSVSGTESNVTVHLWIPLGILTLGMPGDLESLKKFGQQVWRLAAVRTSVDVAGAALPSVPSGGAFYAIYEV